MSSKKEAAKKRRGWLRNGNRPGNLHAVQRCGAKTRRGSVCQSLSFRAKFMKSV